MDVRVLQAERDQLSSQLAELRDAAVGSVDKEAAFQQQMETIKDENVALSKEKASLQVHIFFSSMQPSIYLYM